MKKLRMLFCLVLIAVIAGGLFASGSSAGGAAATANQPWKVSGTSFNPAAFPKAPANYTISILSISQDGTFIASDHPALKNLQDFTSYNIKLEYVLNANYNEQMNTRLAANDLPGIVTITSNTQPIVTAARSGAFWDITDIYGKYPNLARADKGVMSNVSIDGRNFGIYRGRDFPRSGMVYRKDWLQNLGLSVPKNLDDLYNVLYAFTYNDPDGNGKNDTYGMTWTGAYMGPFYNIAVMFGAPNRFGVKNGKLTPWFDYDEFYQAMLYSKKLYDNGLINKDFAALPTSEWALPFGRGQCGWHIDCADEASRSATRMLNNGLMTQADFDAGKYVDVMGAVANQNGEIRVWPQNDGHQGYEAISTAGAKTLQDLNYYLDFMDKCNSAQGITILNWGAEGVNYTLNSDGTVTAIPAAQIPNGWDNLAGLNQFRMLTDIGAIQQPNAYQARHMQVYKDIQPYAILNPVTPITLMSPTWTARQSSLNQIIDDAVINFIMGNIDQAGFQKEVARWYSEDGQKALDELQVAYDASRQ
ncbi:MAG: extracellular solute-binding protein [Treponema sp.]|nr:extracellular solute-binding protein [Treponema sp.]